MNEDITPSIHLVAKEAGVSIATVSRVLNRSKPVSNAARLKVEEAVAQLGYRVNVFGRNLRKAQSKLLMVLVPDIANPYFAEIVRGIESVARVNGYNIILVDASMGLDAEGTSVSAISNRLADGVISLAHIHEDHGLRSIVRSIPWVSCSEFSPDAGVPYVAIDHRQGAVDAVQYLLNRGHKRIALIGGDESNLWAQQRREGYIAALERARIPIDENLIRSASSTDYKDGQVVAASLLALEELPTAVFAVSDTLAIGAIKAFRKVGLRVPNDVAVMGFDNIPIAEVFEPSLTTVSQPMHEIGRVATELLLNLLAGEKPASRILSHSLILRESA
jgi:LacI family repressor for deo operon, udp, cdd, tsx, nupC, and nupG